MNDKIEYTNGSLLALVSPEYTYIFSVDIFEIQNKYRGKYGVTHL